ELFKYCCPPASPAGTASFGGQRPSGGAIGRARFTGALQRLVHDAANGARAAPALRAASEALINLIGRAWSVRAGAGLTHLAVGQYVAGTDDHFGFAL